MDTLTDANRIINVKGTLAEITNIYLRVLLAKVRLTEKQLDVASSLVTRYAVYVRDGVKEPYASNLLFSTESRKGIVKELKISAPHLNNTFKSLLEKHILAKKGDSYRIDPGLIPSSGIIFNFTVKSEVTEDKMEEVRAAFLLSERMPADPVEQMNKMDDAKQRQDIKGDIPETGYPAETSSGSGQIPVELSTERNTGQGYEVNLSEESGFLDTKGD